MDNSDLGNRMKDYEDVNRFYLTKRTPTIIRLDGKAFHTFTKGFQKPFDKVFSKSMWDTAQYLCKNIMGCKIAYTQSDEITLLLTDYDDISTQAWFGKNIVKMVSVSSSMATMAFNDAFAKNANQNYFVSVPYDNTNGFDISDKQYEIYSNKFRTAMFDSRVFNIPKEEVNNCFLWRQLDATRNSIQSIGQANFSHKELQNKNCNQIQEMLWQEKGINFNDYPTYQKRGVCIIKKDYEIQTEPHEERCYRSRWIVDENIPIFTQDKEYIEKFVYLK